MVLSCCNIEIFPEQSHGHSYIYFFPYFRFVPFPEFTLMRRKIICLPLKFKRQGKFEIKLFREPCRTIAAKVHLKELFTCKNLLHAGN